VDWGAVQSSPEGCVPAAQGFSCSFDTRNTQTFCLYYSLDHTLLRVSRWQALLAFHSEEISIVRHTHTLDRRQLKSAHYAETTDFSTNNLHHYCCCKPTSHCNKLREPVDLLERLRLRHELRQALWHLSN